MLTWPHCYSIIIDCFDSGILFCFDLILKYILTVSGFSIIFQYVFTVFGFFCTSSRLFWLFMCTNFFWMLWSSWVCYDMFCSIFVFVLVYFFRCVSQYFCRTLVLYISPRKHNIYVTKQTLESILMMSVSENFLLESESFSPHKITFVPS
jgi:hypothetical protein